MFAASDYLLQGLLAVIAVLLLVAIIVMLRRSRHTTINTQNVPLQDPDPEPTRFAQQEKPRKDPVDKYLEHLRTASRTVEPLSDTEYLITMEAWSLPTTMEIAKTSQCDSQFDDYSPTLRLYFDYHDDGSWEIGDRGENAGVLRTITDQFH